MPILIDQKRELFCLLVFQGKSDTAAYMEAYQATRENAESNAWRVKESEGVIDRLRELYSLSVQKADKTVLSMAEKRQFLRDVVLTPVGDVAGTALHQGFSKGGAPTMPCKLKALELDAKLSGELREQHADIRIAVFQAGDGSTVVDVESQ